MRYLLFLITSLLLAVLPANATELLIIQSHSNQAYDQTVRLIQNNCGKSSQTYIMSDYAEFDLGRIVREEKPRLIVAVGDKPLKASLKLRNTPVLYSMALAAEENRLPENVSGVSMHAAPENYLKLFRKIGLHRVGVVYSKGKSGAYLARTAKLAADYGVELVAVQIQSPQEVDAALARLKSSGIDSIWMLPDTAAVTAETVASYFLVSQKSNIPLISFSRAYLEKGALAVLEASRSKMSGQLCSMIAQVFNGTGSAAIGTTDISEAALFTNSVVAQRLGINLSGTEQLFSSGK